MQQLHHPNIIRLHEFWEEPGDPSKRHASPDLAVGDIGIVLDLYSGDLEGLLENRALISNLQQSDLIRDVAKQVFQALEYCHWRDIVHRDIKPGNILWKYNSELSKFHFALADFSLAEAASVAQQAKSAGCGHTTKCRPRSALIIRGHVCTHETAGCRQHALPILQESTGP